MKFTTKQINKILNVQEFVAMSDTLARIYLEYDDKEYLIDTFTDRDRIYRIYAAVLLPSCRCPHHRISPCNDEAILRD